MKLLASLVGSLGVGYPAYVAFHEFYIQGKLLPPFPVLVQVLILALVLAVGYFIARGRDLARGAAWPRQVCCAQRFSWPEPFL